ncbi:MAG TPA: oligoribonuclease [Candidatus Saccharimonadales bacterium]|nr:oligoribonuclease [Candidatus Saccharimonadales bacterium]
MSFNGYVVVDVETTGLDEGLDTILELGILIADARFNVLASFSEVAYFDFGLSRGGIDDLVIDMHKKNGLWDACKASRHSLAGIQASAVGFLKEGGWENQPMCGSTIQFDRKFIAAYMPKLDATFHYRHIDVSSFKNIFLKYEWDTDTKPQNRKLHRSLPDCEDTLSELKAYVTTINQWRDRESYSGVW